MAQILLIPLGQAIGGAIGGAIATAIGGAIGAVAGEYINGLLKPPTRTEGPRLQTQEITASTEGSAVTRLWGRSRLSGNIIWATRFKEESIERSTGGKGGPKVISTEYSYYMNFAVALCEGPVSHIGRIWANGKEVDQSKYTIRKYLGSETQTPDELIEAKEGAGRTCAYRGTAYIVFELLSVEEYGSQPQISAEVWRTVGSLESTLSAINLHPDAGEFGFDTLEQGQNEEGEAAPENRHVLTADTDFLGAMDEMQAIAPAVDQVTLSPQWFGNDLRCGKCAVQPGVRVSDITVNPASTQHITGGHVSGGGDGGDPLADWHAHTASRNDAAPVTHIFDQPLYGGTPDDSALARAVFDLQSRGMDVTLAPKLSLDPAPVTGWLDFAIDDMVITWSPDLHMFTGLDMAGHGGTSIDGLSWSSHSVTTRSWRSICWSPARKMFVAVADNASGTTIASSVDGIEWLERSTVAGGWREVIWVETLGRFVAVGDTAPNAIWSDDGINWTAGSATARSWYDLIYAPALSKFLALDNASNKVMTSSDGKSWTEQSTSGNPGTWGQGLCWSAKLGKFLAIYNYLPDKVVTSSDGLVWGVVLNLSISIGHSVEWAQEAGVFMITTSSGDTVRTSVDGTTWVGHPSVGVSLPKFTYWCADLHRFVIGDGYRFYVSNAQYKPATSALSCDPAFDQPGTPDAGGNAIELAAQLNAFFGTCVAAEITLTYDAGSQRVSTAYSGSDGWTYRRFILHYAKLAAALNADTAGTVTSFIIGSGMSGMTRLRASNNPEIEADYLVTVALQSLAAEVAAVLGGAVEIGYVAEADEYGALALDSGRVGFPLDALWADGNIDFVGINAAFPLADWRDGLSHLDALAGVSTIYDPAYLSGNIEAGEGFEWTYDSDADRDSQTRTNITDATLNKPWVFRNKDLRNWWLNSHRARTATDTEAGSDTSWVAEAKPLRLNVICPAIDKGANDPSAQFDPVSTDHGRPHYSSGARDDAMQRAYLDAVLGYWNDIANNPVSAVYADKMIDTGHLSVGWYDARPASTFPMDGRYWADADNHEYGAWISGRLGQADAAGTIAAICADFGFTNYTLGPLGASVDGITGQGGNSARSIFEAIQPALLFDVTESTSGIRFQQRGGQVVDVDGGVLVMSEESEPWQILRAQETDLPIAVEVSFGEVATDDQRSAAQARRGVGGSDRTTSVDLPVITGQSRARTLAEIMLAEMWMARESMETALPPSLLAVEAGDVLRIGDQRGFWRVASITDGQARTAQLSRFDPRIYVPIRFPRRAKHPVGSDATGATGSAQATPVPFFMDLPLLLDSHNPDAGYLAAYMKPIGAGIAAYRSPSSSNYSLDLVLPLAAITGLTLAPFNAGVLNRWDNASVLDVEIKSDELSASDDLSVLAGANAMAIKQPDGEWEIIQFVDAEIIGTRQYRLTRLLRGQKGSEHAMADPLAAGARCILLDAAVLQTGLDAAQIGLALNWRIGPASNAVGDAVFGETAFTFNAIARRPYAPVHLKAKRSGSNDIDLGWVRRSRLGADSWNQTEIPLGEDSEAYEIDIMIGAVVVRTLTTATPSATYIEADQITDFGSPPASLTFNVYQLSTSFGRGMSGAFDGAIL